MRGCGVEHRCSAVLHNPGILAETDASISHLLKCANNFSEALPWYTHLCLSPEILTDFFLECWKCQNADFMNNEGDQSDFLNKSHSIQNTVSISAARVVGWFQLVAVADVSENEVVGAVSCRS